MDKVYLAIITWLAGLPIGIAVFIVVLILIGVIVWKLETIKKLFKYKNKKNKRSCVIAY